MISFNVDFIFMSNKYITNLFFLAKAPRPVITSVNATATSLNVTWNKGQSTKCQIRYRCSTTEQWTVVKHLLQKSVEVFGRRVLSEI